MLALLQLLLRPPPPAVALAAARLLCAAAPPSGRAPFSVGGRWEAWMEARGLAAVRRAFSLLEPSEEACACAASLVFRVPEAELDAPPESSHLACPPLLPALLDQCARAPPALRQRTLERLALWLRQCPGGADAFTATAPLWLPHLASVLADAFRSKASALVGTLCVELLCSYAVEALARDERWVALDILLATVESCAAPPLSCGRLTLQRIRRALLTRLLSSLVRSAQRFASAAPVGGAASFAPRLRKLCAAVRAHVLQPPPPPPPLRVLLHVPSGGTRVNLTVAKNVAPFNDAAATARTRWERLMAAEGAEGVAAEVALLARLCEVLDPLVVRAMMDGAADALLHAKDDDGQNLITQGLTQAGSLAGSLAGRLKGIGATAVSTVTGARTSGAGAGRGGGGGGGVAIGAEGVEALVGESDVSLRGGVCAASLYESLTFAPSRSRRRPPPPPPMPGAAAASTPAGHARRAPRHLAAAT